MWKPAIRLIVAAALLAAAGCSSVYMKGTPLYTGEYSKPQGPPEERVNLWPLAYYHKPALSVLWPFIEFTDDHVAIRPLFSVYKLDKPDHQWNIMPPLIQFDFDGAALHYRVGPIIWGVRKPGEPYFVAAPLVWWFKDTKGIVPVFWWRDGFTVFPLVWHEKGDYTAIFPFWIHSRQGQRGCDTHVLWPVFRRLDLEDKKGWRLWPLAGHYDYPKRNQRETYVLWPFCHFAEKGDESSRTVFPFYFDARFGKGGGDRRTLLVPAFYRERKGADSLLITPLWSAGTKGDTRWEALAPLFYRRVDSKAGTETLVTPLAARSKSPDRTQWTAVPLLSSVAWGKGEKDIWLLAPLAHARWGGGNVQHHILPLYEYDRNDGHFLSLLASWRRKLGEGFLNIGTILFHSAWHNNGDREVVLPFLLTGAWWNADKREAKKGVATFPLFSWRKSSYGNKLATDSEALWVFPWFSAERSHTVRPKEDGKPPQTRSTTRRSSLFPLWHYRRQRATDDGGKLTGSTSFTLLGWLYGYHIGIGEKDAKDPRKTHDTIRSRLLVRLMHYEKLDGDESLDVFPFITWDRKADGYRKVSFLWRLYRNERKADGSRALDLFFLPLLRKRGG